MNFDAMERDHDARIISAIASLADEDEAYAEELDAEIGELFEDSDYLASVRDDVLAEDETQEAIRSYDLAGRTEDGAAYVDTLVGNIVTARAMRSIRKRNERAREEYETELAMAKWERTHGGWD